MVAQSIDPGTNRVDMERCRRCAEPQKKMDKMVLDTVLGASFHQYISSDMMHTSYDIIFFV